MGLTRRLDHAGRSEIVWIFSFERFGFSSGGARWCEWDRSMPHSMKNKNKTLYPKSRLLDKYLQ
jgi:hypothetical protein